MTVDIWLSGEGITAQGSGLEPQVRNKLEICPEWPHSRREISIAGIQYSRYFQYSRHAVLALEPRNLGASNSGTPRRSAALLEEGVPLKKECR